MNTFVEHYFQEKFTSDIKRAFTSNLLKKRKVGIEIGKGKYKKIIEASSNIFKDVLDELQSGAKAFFTGQKEKKAFFGKKGYGGGLTSTLRKLSGTEIKGVYEGEIDSGFERIKGNPESSLVFEVQNGARIAFITSQDGDDIRYYISTNTRGNDFFRENLGTTLEQLGAESKSKINKSYKKEIEKNKENGEPEFEELPEEPSSEDESNEFGILDISKEEFIGLKSDWGTGQKSAVKGALNPFKGKLSRQLYHNNTTGYGGYKYSDNLGHEVYLLDVDEKNAMIVFKDKKSYAWAKDIGMLNIWRSGEKRSSILWKKGNIENNLE